jgi:hypothetical protein
MREFLAWARNQPDRLAGWLCIAVGALALLLGWVGASGEAIAGDQIPYVISGGLFGIFLLGLGGVLLLSADLRDEWRQLERLERTLAADQEPDPEPTAPTAR